MGVIIRQGIKHSIVTFVSTLVGMINILFLYTYFLSEKEFGFFQYIVSIGQFIAQFLTLGFGSVAIHFFPIFRKKSTTKNGFLFFLLFIPLSTVLLFLAGSFIFQKRIYQFFENHPDILLINEHFHYIAFLIFIFVLGIILTNYISNFNRIVIPAICNNLFIKIAVPTMAACYFYAIFSFSAFLIAIIFIYLFSNIFLLIYLWRLEELDIMPKWLYFDKPIIGDIKNYATYSVLGGLGTYLVAKIDVLMIGYLIDMENVAIYTVALFIATVISIPYKSLVSITSPIIATSWRENDLANIQNIYRKTSLNLLIVGVLLLVGIWSSVDPLFELVPDGEAYKLGKNVILILGTAKIIDMVTGLNTHIIIYSDLYRYNLYFSLILAVINVIFNVIFIYQYGMIGVAIASLSSIFLFNALKSVFVWIKFDMHPFSWKMLWILGLGFLSYGITILLPKTTYPILDIIINSVVIVSIYLPLILYLNVSEDFTKLKSQILEKISHYFEKRDR